MLLMFALLPLFALLLSVGPQHSRQQQDEIPFNVDLQFPMSVKLPNQPDLHRSQSIYPALFGSSVLVTSVDSKHSSLFVGSPKLVSRNNFSNFPGGIFKCDLDLVHGIQCNELIIDNRKNEFTQYEIQNNSLLGFNLIMGSSSIISCAPNWITTSHTPEGLCFMLEPASGKVLNSFKLPTKQRLMSERPFESHCLFGYSIAFNKFEESIVAGIPGFSDFEGSITTTDKNLKTTTRVELDRAKINSYKGFSLAFLNIGKIGSIVIGTPRYNKFRGKVDLVEMSSKKTVFSLHSLNDTWGEFFGSSLLVIGADLLVGAPLYSAPNRREIGRVYYYKNLKMTDHHVPTLTFTPKSVSKGAHFGTTIESIDLNMDELVDVIINSPFEDNKDGSSGAIYIYYRGQDGLNFSVEKRIGAEIFANNAFRGFGYSLWMQSDVDRNGYNDLVIGSILSDKVAVLRTFPVIDLKLEVWFDRKGVNLTDICASGNSCFTVNYCIQTSAKQTFPEAVNFTVNFLVSDSKIRLRENRVLTERMSSVVHTKNSRICKQDSQAFLVEMKRKEDLYDIITPIEMQLSVNLVRPTFKQFCALCPVASPITVFKEIDFEHGCARKRCVAKLDLNVQFKYGHEPISDVIVQGRFGTIEMLIEVLNSAESSIDTVLLILISPLTSLLARSLESRCRVNSADKEPKLFRCDVNKLLQHNQKEELRLHIDLASIESKSFTFRVNVNSSSELAPDSRTIVSKHIAITKEASFQFFGGERFNFSFSDQTPRVVSPLSLHVNKDGPSSVNSSKIAFYLPRDIVEIDPLSKMECTRVSIGRWRVSESWLINQTLHVSCNDPSEICSKYECKTGTFPTGRNGLDVELILHFHPSTIKNFDYIQMLLDLHIELFPIDVFLDKHNTAAASITSKIVFDRQISEIQTKANPLIMVGGGGVGLLILLITVIVLIKNGFFKRKKRQEILRAKQRMSMNPNLVIPNMNTIDLNEMENDQETNEHQNAHH